MSTAVQTLTVLAADQQLPEDIGKSGPLGLLLIVVLLIATAVLVKSMSGHLKKLPPSFDPDAAGEPGVDIPDDLSELDGPDPAPQGHDLLEKLRRAPLALEAPRDDDGRPGGTPPA